MTTSIKITNVKFQAADPGLVRTGLLGWTSVLLNDTIRLDSIAVRRTADGRHALSFPARRDQHGGEHAIFAPIDDDSRRDIERQVFAALGLAPEAGR